MTISDFEVHMDRDQFDSLWRDTDSDSEVFPFGEDTVELDRIIAEEIGAPRRRKRPKRHSR